MALHALLEWTVDKTLSVLPVTCIVKGSSCSKGELVQANFQKKTYEALILEIGEFVCLFSTILYLAS